VTPPSKNSTDKNIFPLPPPNHKPLFTYQRISPHNPSIIKKLFQGILPLPPPVKMSPSWTNRLYKPLNFQNIVGQPHEMPKDIAKWLPKFSGNNVVTVEEHIDQLIHAFEIMYVEHDDVSMKLFAISLEGPAKNWYLAIVDNTITSYTDFVSNTCALTG
jgi:hypothetical protein